MIIQKIEQQVVKKHEKYRSEIKKKNKKKKQIQKKNKTIKKTPKKEHKTNLQVKHDLEKGAQLYCLSYCFSIKLF